MKHHILYGGAVLLTVFALCGCSSSDKSTDKTADQANTPADPGRPQPAASSGNNMKMQIPHEDTTK
jgi:hypothetical protein